MIAEVPEMVVGVLYCGTIIALLVVAGVFWFSDRDKTPEMYDSKATKAKLAEEIMKTADCKQPLFWVPKKGWFVKLPDGVRPYDEAALLVVTTAGAQKGVVDLRYSDHTVVRVFLSELLDTGIKLLPSEVTQKYHICRPGEKDMQGNIHRAQ